MKYFNLIFRSGKLSRSLIRYILIFTVLPAVIIFLFANYFTTRILIEKNINKYLELTYINIERSIDEFINNINLETISFTEDIDIYNILADPALSHYDKAFRLYGIAEGFLSAGDVIDGLAVITNDGQRFQLGKNSVRFPEANTDFIRRDSKYGLSMSHTPQKGSDGEDYLLFGKRLRQHSTAYHPGSLLIYVNESNFRRLYEEGTPENSQFYLTLDGYIISHPDKSMLGAFSEIPTSFLPADTLVYSKDKKFLMNLHHFSNRSVPSLAMYSLISCENLSQTSRMFNIEIILFGILSLLLAFLLSALMTHRLVKSILNLRKKLIKYGQNGEADFSLLKNDELLELEKSFREMVIEIEHLVQKNEEEQKRQKVAELAALQAQINPHFIYNALDVISWTAKIKNQPEIEKIVIALASFFRISLHKGDNIITIDEEIKHIQSYITIEQSRFPDTFEVFYDIDENILPCKTIKIILQPLVENAVKHAFPRLKRMGEIHITGYTDGNDIYFEVADNGRGMDFDPLTVKLDKAFSGGYGVFNVNERIRLEYGEGYGLTYSSVPGEGTTVTVKIKRQL